MFDTPAIFVSSAGTLKSQFWQDFSDSVGDNRKNKRFFSRGNFDNSRINLKAIPKHFEEFGQPFGLTETN